MQNKVKRRKMSNKIFNPVTGIQSKKNSDRIKRKTIEFIQKDQKLELCNRLISSKLAQ